MREDYTNQFTSINEVLQGIFKDSFGLDLPPLATARRVDLTEKSQETHSLRTENNKLVFETVLPGADKKDISVELDGVLMRVRYKAAVPNRFAPNFDRQWNVGNVKATDITASFNAGVLRVEVQKEEKAPQKVVVISVL